MAAPPPCDFCPTSKNMVEQMRERAAKQLAEAMPAPPAPEELGRATWTLLHTMAAAYPEQPDAATQAAATAMVTSLGTVYPCKWCRTDWALEVAASPPAVQSRASLEQWMCVAHNNVNRKLGKAEFDCTRVRQRWGGNGHQ